MAIPGEMRYSSGLLVNRADGGYPVYYVSQDHHGAEYIVCVTHANDIEQQNREEMNRPKEDEHDTPFITETITDYAVNWEDDELYCEACSDGRPNQRIPSAYGDAPDNDICTGY